jgi:uncharacterized OsmC-like protein
MPVREAIENLGKALAAQPERARVKGAPATARLVDGLRSVVEGPGGESVQTDMARAFGGAASAPAPGWLFRAAMASCTASCIALRAAKQGIELSMVEVTVESLVDNRGMLGLDERVPAGLSAITTRVKIGASGVEAHRLRELVDWADRHSPIACTARGSPDYALEVEVV